MTALVTPLGPSAIAARAESRELVCEVEVLAAGERDEVAIVERFAPDDLGEPDRCLAVFDLREQRADFVEHFRCDVTRVHVRAARMRTHDREAARTSDPLA